MTDYEVSAVPFQQQTLLHHRLVSSQINRKLQTAKAAVRAHTEQHQLKLRKSRTSATRACWASSSHVEMRVWCARRRFEYWQIETSEVDRRSVVSWVGWVDALSRSSLGKSRSRWRWRTLTGDEGQPIMDRSTRLIGITWYWDIADFRLLKVEGNSLNILGYCTKHKSFTRGETHSQRNCLRISRCASKVTELACYHFMTLFGSQAMQIVILQEVQS